MWKRENTLRVVHFEKPEYSRLLAPLSPGRPPGVDGIPSVSLSEL